MLWAAWVFIQALRAAWARPDPRAVAAADAAASAPPVEASSEAPREAQAAEPAAPSSLEAAPPAAAPPVPGPGPRARRAGMAALALLVVGLGFNIAWASRHFDALRPMEHGEAAPEFDLPRIDGTAGRLALSSLRGNLLGIPEQHHLRLRHQWRVLLLRSSTSVGSGLDLADFLMGNPDEYTQSPKAPSNIRSHQYAGFGQDTWHTTKNLTLTFGLRYEYAQPKYDTQGRTFSFIPGLQSQRFPNSPPGLVYPGDPGAPTGSNFPDKTNFSPRFGFAYDVFGNAKTSLRGGFGMFYDILKGEDNLQFNGQPPFFAYADIYPTTYTGIGPSGLQDPFASAGATNPFPSKPPAKDINFADCRLSSLRRWRHLSGRPESENSVRVPIQHVHTAAASLEYAAGGGLPRLLRARANEPR